MADAGDDAAPGRRGSTHHHRPPVGAQRKSVDGVETVAPEDAFYVYQQAQCRRCGSPIRVVAGRPAARLRLRTLPAAGRALSREDSWGTQLARSRSSPHSRPEARVTRCGPPEIAAFEVRRALFAKRGSALAIVFAVEAAWRHASQGFEVALVGIEAAPDRWPSWTPRPTAARCRRSGGRSRTRPPSRSSAGHDAIDQPDPERFVGADARARVQNHPRVRRADQRDQSPQTFEAIGDAQLGRRMPN